MDSAAHWVDADSLPPPPPEFFATPDGGPSIQRQQSIAMALAVADALAACQGIDPGLTNAHGRTAKEVIARDTPNARDLHQILHERMSAVGAVATRDFCNLADPSSIAFRCGEHVTVVERSAHDTWKGFVTREGLSRAGYFPSSAVRLLQQPPQPHLPYRPDGLVPCSVPQPPPQLEGAATATEAAGNRNSAASLDSGRSSAHTAASSDTRVSAQAAIGHGPAALTAASAYPGAAVASTAAAAAAVASSASSPGSAAAVAAAIAAAAASTPGGGDSGLGGPHRRSVVSTCSSTGSLGSSLPDDSSSVSSGEHQQQLPEDWHRLTAPEQLAAFLTGCQLGSCLRCLADAGYDLPTLVRCTPEDLNAAGVTNPRDRKRLRQELGRLAQTMQTAGLPDSLDEAAAASARQRNLDSVGDFCGRLGLPDSVADCLRRGGLVTVRDLAQMAWEDLEEIGISRLGHQKKLVLAIDRVRRPRRCPASEAPAPCCQDCGNGGQCESATLRRQPAHKQTVSCGTCTTTDIIVRQTDPFLAATEATAQQQLQLPSQAHAHTRSLSSGLGVAGFGDSPGSPRAARPVAKILGRPIPVPVPEVPQPPPPLPTSEKQLPTGAGSSPRIPPPPPKRVTSVRRCSADSSPCASPPQPPRGSPRRTPAAYENAAALVETAAARLATASASGIPFANEDCGTIRHKPHPAAAVAAAAVSAIASPQLHRRLQQQQQQQQQHSLLPASPAFVRRAAHAVPASVPGPVPPSPLPGARTPARRVLQPPTPRDDDSLTNLDDICGMLSDLQGILDKELREQHA